MLTKIPTDPLDAAWGVPGWPEWVTAFRPHQLDALEEIMHLYANGTDVVLLDAPTGSGKTIIAEGVRRLLHAPRSAYIANTNSLLHQFHGDFGYSAPLKGKSNYPTLDRPELFNLRGEEALTCADCMPTMAVLPACSACPQNEAMPDERIGATSLEDTIEQRSLHCDHCHPFAACPYREARFIASDSPLVVTNTAYYIADTQLAANSILNGRDFVTVDECDTLESILMGHIEVNISRRTAQDLDLKPPDKKTVEEAWVEWLESEAKPKVKSAIDSHRSRKSATPRWMKQKVRLDRLAGKLDTLTTELANSNAVYDGYDKGDIIFRPIKVDTAAPALFWSRSRRWLAMSATLFPDEFIDSTGLEHTDLKVDVVRVPSTFPVERRPIYYNGVANNVYKERDTAWPKVADGIVKWLDSRPDARTLIHTVSYGFTAFLEQHFVWENTPAHNREIISYTKSSEREAALAQFKRSAGPAVLLAPSMDRGIDLPGEECELIIITKMPFMSTNDKQVAKRMYAHNGRLWYSVQTLKSLVQMTGRGMRSADDLCECVILDQQFLTNVWRNNRRYLPAWWTESVDFGGGGI